MADNTNNKTSLLVSSQLPAFVREEHDQFVNFLEYYYKFLEEDGGQQYVAKNFLHYLNIDNIKADIDYDATAGEAHRIREESDYHAFLQKMYDTFIQYVPDAVLADKTLILKHAKEFYRSAGSEKSVRFLIQALFNKTADFYYPKTDVLRASDGKWFIEKSLKITDIRVDNTSNSIAGTNFANTTIRGMTSGATAIVEKVDTYFDKAKLINELKLSSIYKEFLNNEKIYAYYTEEGVDKYLTANLFSGVITFVTITNGGSGYTEGTTVPIVSGSGSGAQIIISKVTKGSVQAAGVTAGGAGFRVDDPLLFIGDGVGAAGIVADVDKSGFYHPNSYNVIWSTISLEANTALNNTVFSNLNSSNVNTTITNAMSYFVYSNCGPAYSLTITNGGNDYTSLNVSISANSTISKMGILGKMQIINGGLGYVVGNKIEFLNPFGSTGSGAMGNVTSVAANGMITGVKFEQVPGQIIGGSGYDWLNLPTANVISGTGNGANIVVTASIGHNEKIIQSLSNIGTIQALTIISGGTGYSDQLPAAPYLNFASLGDGTANAQLFVVTGVYSYPGRYITDDGHISGYNFLEDRDFYQDFSYVVKVDETINKYRAALKDLTHPAGTRLFGEYDFVFDRETVTNTNVTVTYANTESNTLARKTLYQVQGYTSGVFAPNIVFGSANAEFIAGTFTVNTSNQLAVYSAQSNSIVVASDSHGYLANDRVFLQFVGSNTWANLGNTNYVVTSSNVSHFICRNNLLENLTRSNTGSVRVYNPAVLVNMKSYSMPAVSDNVYLQFQTVDISLANGFYQVLSIKNANTFNVLHPNMTTANDAANVANLITKKIIVTANNHEYNVGDQAYVLFINGDTANTRNGYYSVTSVGSANTFNIAGQKIIFSGSNTRVYQKRSKVVITAHPLSNSNAAYVAFTSGDIANTSNGVYYPIKTGADTFTMNMAKPATGNSNVRVWYQTNNYSNIRFTALRTSSGFTANDNVYIEFYSSATDLANGVYMVKKTYNGNTYNIYYDGNTYIQNAFSTYGSIVYIPANTHNTINIVGHSGLGITTNSIMEGIALVSPYK